jgi:hypothetical protein
MAQRRFTALLILAMERKQGVGKEWEENMESSPGK